MAICLVPAALVLSSLFVRAGGTSVTTPMFSPDGGTFNETIDVLVSCETLDATIHYTTDSSEPTEESPTVASGESIPLSETTTLTAKAFSAGMDPATKSATYTLLIGALGIPPAEFNALVDIYNSTDGPNWTNHSNWLTEDTPWFGVSVEEGHVTGIDLTNNSLAGAIPTSIGDLSFLQQFTVFHNLLSGGIPPEIGDLSLLVILNLAGNQLSGEIPVTLVNLTNLTSLNLGSNQLKVSDPDLLDYLGTHAPWGADSQTVEPTNLTFSGGDASSVILTWKPIQYAWDDGYYEVGISQTPGGPYTFDTPDRTSDKWASSLQVGGLLPRTTYYFVVRTVTLPLWVNQSTLTSDPSNEVSVTPNALGVPQSEYDALVALYVSTDGDNWTDNTNWLTDTAPWFGVSTENGHIIELLLSPNNLVGSLPVEMKDLTGIKRIWLDNNLLSGEIPAELGNLASLESLAISVNQLSGAIPSALGNLTHLNDIWLDNNQLSGSIPISLGNLTNLQILQLSNNQLTGSIPVELGGLANLIRLWMGGNQLSGAIPAELGNLANLESMSFDFNQLTGTIPPELGNLSKLTDIFLNNNQLTGSIPPALANPANLQSLQLSDNQLTGSLPVELANLTNLINLWLSNNQLSGTLPPELGNLSNLQNLSLGLNNLTGTIPPELANLTNLTGMWLNRNQLFGSVPDLGALTQMVTLDLSQNLLSGGVPAWLPSLTSLLNLELFRNQFTGTIPSNLATLSHLQRLTLSYNNLDGEIPAELSAMHGLTYVSLAGNSLTGTIPPWFALLPNLTGLSLRINKFSGAVPAELGNMTQLTSLALSNNQLSGEIPASLANLTNIITTGGGLMLEYNCLAAHDAALISYLDARNPGWALTQTIAPGNVHVAGVGTDHLSLAWTPINYTGDGGYYEVGMSDTAGGPYAFAPPNRTSNKSAGGITITGIASGTDKRFVVRTFTPAHGVLNSSSSNKSDLTSGPTAEVSGRTLSSAEAFGLWISGLNWSGFTSPDLSPAGDPDGDAMANQQEFAFGLDPRRGSSVNPITSGLSGQEFSYTRRIGTGLTYAVCYSTDLMTWSPDNSAVQNVTGISGDVETVAVTLSPAAAPSGGRLFVRVQAE